MPGTEYSPGGERGGITIARADGTGLRKVTSLETSGYELSEIHGIDFPDDHPPLSPDGMHIVFASNRADPDNDEDHDIFVMRPNGTEIAPLYAAPGLDVEPTSSPDGTKIAFRYREDGGTRRATTPPYRRQHAAARKIPAAPGARHVGSCSPEGGGDSQDVGTIARLTSR